MDVISFTHAGPPENEPLGQSPVTVNAVMDIMVCREVLENLTTAYRILELEDPRAEKTPRNVGEPASPCCWTRKAG